MKPQYNIYLLWSTSDVETNVLVGVFTTIPLAEKYLVKYFGIDKFNEMQSDEYGIADFCIETVIVDSRVAPVGLTITSDCK